MLRDLVQGSLHTLGMESSCSIVVVALHWRKGDGSKSIYSVVGYGADDG